MAGHRIIEHREARGWTQEELGLRVNRTKWQISRIESGKTRLDLETARQLAVALEVPLAVLLGHGAHVRGAAASTAAQGLAEELVPYAPTPGDPLAAFATQTRNLCVVDCDSLSGIAINRGDIVVVDHSQEAVDTLRPLAAVRVRLHPRNDFMRPVTLLRQFVPPRLLITNANTSNQPSIDMDKEDAHIVGVVVSAHRQMP